MAMAESRQGMRFQRRSMLKAMMALPIAGWMPLPALATEIGRVLPEGPPVVDAEAWRLRVLTPHEWKTVGVMSDWILPADETSGSAGDAGVPEFIDEWLEFQGGELLVQIRGGLAWMDAECRQSWQQDFVEVSADRQREMLDRMAYPEKAAAKDAAVAVDFERLFRASMAAVR